VFLDHATAIVVGAFAEIGDEVTILHNVTIGRARHQRRAGRLHRRRRAGAPGQLPGTEDRGVVACFGSSEGFEILLVV
jgi:serine O-acetyltransferase